MLRCLLVPMICPGGFVPRGFWKLTFCHRFCFRWSSVKLKRGLYTWRKQQQQYPKARWFLLQTFMIVSNLIDREILKQTQADTHTVWQTGRQTDTDTQTRRVRKIEWKRQREVREIHTDWLTNMNGQREVSIRWLIVQHAQSGTRTENAHSSSIEFPFSSGNNSSTGSIDQAWISSHSTARFSFLSLRWK